MNLLAIVWAQTTRRPLQTALSLALLALGVATLVFVLVAQAQLMRQATRDVQGIDLVVGAKGSPLQLILAAVYHVDIPTGNVPLAAVDELRSNRYVAQVIPLALGDNYKGFRIVGSEPALIEHYGGRLAAGALWDEPMQAVLGAAVARETALALGARFAGTHGLATDGAVHEDAQYRVVGILAPTGTVLDRLILTDLHSVWLVHEGEATHPEDRRLLEAEREVTALLVRYATPLAAALLPRQVNAQPALMAAVPATELARLFAVVGVGVEVLRAFGAILMGAALLALFVALMNALEERRYDLAIMRLLGASRARIAALLLIEAWLLAAVALAAGFALALLALYVVGAWLAQARSFVLTPLTWTPGLALVVASALATATFAALVPAWRASRMDVHAALAQE
jgi:putative ABC transport system permease protein